MFLSQDFSLGDDFDWTDLGAWCHGEMLSRFLCCKPEGAFEQNVPCRWFEMPWDSCDITVMSNIATNHNTLFQLQFPGCEHMLLYSMISKMFQCWFFDYDSFQCLFIFSINWCAFRYLVQSISIWAQYSHEYCNRTRALHAIYSHDSQRMARDNIIDQICNM